MKRSNCLAEVHPLVLLVVSFIRNISQKPLNAHPLFASFVRAAYENRLQSETSMEKNGEVDLIVPREIERDQRRLNRMSERPLLCRVLSL